MPRRCTAATCVTTGGAIPRPTWGTRLPALRAERKRQIVRYRRQPHELARSLVTREGPRRRRRYFSHGLRYVPRPTRPAPFRRRHRLRTHSLAREPRGRARRGERRCDRRLELRDPLGKLRLFRSAHRAARSLGPRRRPAPARADDGALRELADDPSRPVHVFSQPETSRALPEVRLLSALPDRGARQARVVHGDAG